MLAATDRGTPDTSGGSRMIKPFDLNGLKSCALQERPAKVFIEDLGYPVPHGTTVGDWIESLPKQLAGNDLRRLRDHICQAYDDKRTIVAALGGHVIKTGCGPYLVDWIEQGLLSCVA